MFHNVEYDLEYSALCLSLFIYSFGTTQNHNRQSPPLGCLITFKLRPTNGLYNLPTAHKTLNTYLAAQQAHYRPEKRLFTYVGPNLNG